MALSESFKGILSTVNFTSVGAVAGSFEQYGRMLDAILSAASDHICIFDREGRILYIGQAGAKAVGRERVEMIGKTRQELGFPAETGERLQRERERVFDNGQPFFGTVEYPTVDGLRFYEYTVSPLFDHDGHIEAVLHNARDITEARNFQIAQKQSEERYRALIEASLQYVWTASATGECLTSASSLLSFSGLTEEQASGDGWMQAVHPDDRERCRNVRHKAFAAKTAFEFEYRVRRKDGVYRDCIGRGVPVFDAEGAIREWVGAVTDVTETKQAERDLKTRAAVLDNMAEGVVMTDESSRIVFTNSAFDAMFGYEPGELVGQSGSVLNAYAPEENTRIVTAIVHCLQVRGEWVGEFHNRRKDGTAFVTRARISRLLVGGAIRNVSVQEDITEKNRNAREAEAVNQWLRVANRKLEEQIIINRQQSQELEIQKAELENINRKLKILNIHLASEATTDGLTGLKNHRAFKEFLANAFEKSVRYHRPLSMLMLDVDRFKSLNDTFGHPAGDEILKGVASVLQAAARATDLVARHGGDEFAVILPETEAEGALSIAERIRAAVAEQAWEQSAITISSGVATLTAGMQSPAKLLEAADNALYASKAKGRNFVTHFDAEAKPNLSSGADG